MKVDYIKTTYKELDSLLEKTYESDDYTQSFTIELKDSDVKDNIVAFVPIYVLTDLGISVMEGLYQNFDVESNTYQADFDLTLIYDTIDVENLNLCNYVYWEQDPPTVAIHNYLNIIANYQKENGND